MTRFGTGFETGYLRDHDNRIKDLALRNRSMKSLHNLTSKSARGLSDSCKALLYLLAAVALYGVINFPLLQFSANAWDQSLNLISIVAYATAILSALTIVTGIFQWPPRIAILFGLILLTSLVTNLTSLYLAKSVVTRADIVWMWAEADRLGDVILGFGRKAVIPLVGGLFAVTCLWVIAQRLRPLLLNVIGKRRFGRIRVASTLGFTSILATYGFALPAGPAESNLYSFGIYAATLTAAKEEKLSLAPDIDHYRKVVIVMDESVRADVFHLQAAKDLPKDSVDLGTALSTGNCSASSNSAMRWGIAQRDIGVATDLRTNPTLWQFAKRAGFHTVLIDDQSNGKHQNFLSPQELSQIDEFIPAQSGVDTDFQTATALKQRMKSIDHEFIYIVLRGSHFPYSGNLPPIPKYHGLSRLQGYKDSVAFTTGGFLGKLEAPEFHAPDVLLLYTADHGQLFAGGSTHCSGEYRIDEYLVPMVVVGGGSLVDDIRAARSCNLDRVDHQRLRTTALVAMGYAWDDLARMTYFPPLTMCVKSNEAVRLRGKLPWVTAKGETLDLSIWNGGSRLPTTEPPQP